MKFNEKLIELRKKEGLSQEELGYKLNVTRQTVSKWELGQTTPEMDKLVEMSKIFNISVDELVNSETTSVQNTVIEDQPIGNEGTKENKVKILIIGALIIVILLIGINIFNKGFNVFKDISTSEHLTEEAEGIFDKFFNLFDKFFNLFDKAIDTQQNVLDQSVEHKNEMYANFENVFNFVNKEIQDTLDQEAENSNEIDMNFEESVSQFEISKFNSSFELYAGSSKGALVISVLDNIITSNKTEERKITVKYMETETQNEDEIKNIKYNIEKFDDYEVTFEYDTDGFINKAIIEKL